MFDQTTEVTLLQALKDAYNKFCQYGDFSSFRTEVHATGLVVYGPLLDGDHCVVYLKVAPKEKVTIGRVPASYTRGW